MTIEQRMQKTIDHLLDLLKGVNCNLSQALIESIKINAYNSQMPLRQIALVNQNDRGFTITAFDTETTSAIHQAIKNAGFNVVLASKKSLLIPKSIPSPEQRNKTEKHVKRLGEDAKISLRNIRREEKKNGTDDKIIDCSTTKYTEQIDRIIKNVIGDL